MWGLVCQNVMHNFGYDGLYGQQPGLGTGFNNLKGICCRITIIWFKQHFQFSGSLPFKAGCVSQAKQGGNGVKKPPAA